MNPRIFAYLGILGMEIFPDSPGVLSKPETDNGQIGVLLDAAHLEITDTALQLLEEIPRGSDGLGELECFKADDNVVCFGWLGGPKKMIPASKVETSRDWDPQKLRETAKIVEIELPPAFTAAVEARLAKDHIA